MKKIQVYILLSAFIIAIQSCKKDEKITKSDPQITWNNPADISFGTLLSATQLNATADVPGVFVYAPAIGTKLEVGANQDLATVFTPTDASLYNTATKTVKINVIATKGNPVITWNNPADISFGTLLSATQLNATADVPGVIIYSPPIGTKLEIGANQELGAVFTPTDASAFNTATKTVKINVTAFAPLHDPLFSLSFNDNPTNHNIHITSDGTFYYTSNGGDYTKGKINKYTLSGVFVTSYEIKIDMRSLMYNKTDKYFYVSGFEGNTSERNIYKILDLASGSFIKLYPNLYDYYQSGTALSYDCQYIYAFNKGTLKKYKFSDGSLVETLTGLNYGISTSSDGAVAVDNDYIYTWDSSTKTVYVYDLTGKFVRNMTLTNGSFGYSLSFVDGLLFVSVDAVNSIGTWYGYNIRRPL
jgi:hypothetical protein